MGKPEKKSKKAVSTANVGLRPLFQYIAVRVDEKPEKTNGVYIPGSVDKRMETGTVLAVGEGRILMSGEALAPRVKVGDRVIFRDIALEKNGNWECPNQVDLPDNKIYFVEDIDIMAVVE